MSKILDSAKKAREEEEAKDHESWRGRVYTESGVSSVL
jgi:hypothetical protein